ncbi:alpha/beta fold hydrolase [Lignipirellula cremea]|uniref:Alpha/beta hydrolase family protein n=1 Tax=Lignipirellula cremea TaxID=2528010 RepID=A0A518DWK7_9BACT|nr:alpha/beta fold hydrolase [Lignipirellula cremea]QDU96204.1 Alpha/beta hydrolase family protein [Lignipirellula cremea]
MLVDLVSAKASDGLRLDGAILDPHPTVDAPALALDAVLCLPGVGGNFYSSTLQESLTPMLRGLGLSVLWANTRGHDGLNTAISTGRRKRQGAAYEIVDECRLDIHAWLDFLQQRGLARVLLLGHSLGAIKAVYAAAHEPHPAMAGLVAASPPRLSYAEFCRSVQRDAFLATISEAESCLEEGRPLTLLEGQVPFPLLISAQAYLDKYGPAERYNLLRFAGGLSVPTLFTYGEVELNQHPFAGLPDALAALSPANEPFAIETIAAADHFYTNRRDALGESISQWLQRFAE